MIQANVIGGICHCSVRLTRGNKKYMGSLYNREIESSYLLCFNITNLYQLAMSKQLLYIKFEWV